MELITKRFTTFLTTYSCDSLLYHQSEERQNRFNSVVICFVQCKYQNYSTLVLRIMKIYVYTSTLRIHRIKAWSLPQELGLEVTLLSLGHWFDPGSRVKFFRKGSFDPGSAGFFPILVFLLTFFRNDSHPKMFYL